MSSSPSARRAMSYLRDKSRRLLYEKMAHRAMTPPNFIRSKLFLLDHSILIDESHSSSSKNAREIIGNNWISMAHGCKKLEALRPTFHYFYAKYIEDRYRILKLKLCFNKLRKKMISGNQRELWRRMSVLLVRKNRRREMREFREDNRADNAFILSEGKYQIHQNGDDFSVSELSGELWKSELANVPTENDRIQDIIEENSDKKEEIERLTFLETLLLIRNKGPRGMASGLILLVAAAFFWFGFSMTMIVRRLLS